DLAVGDDGVDILLREREWARERGNDADSEDQARELIEQSAQANLDRSRFEIADPILHGILRRFGLTAIVLADEEVQRLGLIADYSGRRTLRIIRFFAVRVASDGESSTGTTGSQVGSACSRDLSVVEARSRGAFREQRFQMTGG